MKTTRRALLAALSLAILLGGCNSIDMPSGSSKGYSSARLVNPAGAKYVGEAIEDTPEVADAVRAAIEANFNANGFSFGSSDSQLVVAFMLIRQDLVTTATNSDYFGVGRDADEILEEAHKRGVIDSQRFESFEAGAIVIDVLDAKSNKLIYRDFAKRDIDPSATAGQRKQRINQAVASALAKFFR
ncbi:MAG: DUF4136 domain-containing protein [Verrucomicrobiales bacterium]|nr:DUF4136 domain-containing protein [Verrucomicrobiales bacterium]